MEQSNVVDILDEAVDVIVNNESKFHKQEALGFSKVSGTYYYKTVRK